jgi:hypothetical protein
MNTGAVQRCQEKRVSNAESDQTGSKLSVWEELIAIDRPSPEEQARRESAWQALIEKHRLTPEQEARREQEFQSFVRDWTRDPWRAEQASKFGEPWLRACFNSAALAYAAGRVDEATPAADAGTKGAGESGRPT